MRTLLIDLTFSLSYLSISHSSLRPRLLPTIVNNLQLLRYVLRESNMRLISVAEVLLSKMKSSLCCCGVSISTWMCVHKCVQASLRSPRASWQTSSSGFWCARAVVEKHVVVPAFGGKPLCTISIDYKSDRITADSPGSDNTWNEDIRLISLSTFFP